MAASSSGPTAVKAGMPAPPDQLGADLSAALATLEALKVTVREAEEAKAARKAARARTRAGAPGTPRPDPADAVHAGGPTGPRADLPLNVEVEASTTPTLHEGTETAAMAAELPLAGHHAEALAVEPETAVPDGVQLYDPMQSTEVPVHDLEADPTLNPMGIKVEDAAAGMAVASNEVIDISDDEPPVAAPPVAPGARGRPRSCRRLQLEPPEATAGAEAGFPVGSVPHAVPTTPGPSPGSARTVAGSPLPLAAVDDGIDGAAQPGLLVPGFDMVPPAADVPAPTGAATPMGHSEDAMQCMPSAADPLLRRPAPTGAGVHAFTQPNEPRDAAPTGAITGTPDGVDPRHAGPLAGTPSGSMEPRQSAPTGVMIEGHRTSAAAAWSGAAEDPPAVQPLHPDVQQAMACSPGPSGAAAEGTLIAAAGPPTTTRFRDPALIGKLRTAAADGSPVPRAAMAALRKGIERDGKSGKLTAEQLQQWHAVQKTPGRVKNQWLLDFAMGKFVAEAVAFETNRQTHAEGLKRTLQHLDEDGLRRLYGPGAWTEGTPEHARVAEIMANPKKKRKNPLAKDGVEWEVYIGTEDFATSTHSAERGAEVAVSLDADGAQLAVHGLAGRGLKRHASEASSAEPKPKAKAKAKAKATAAAAQQRATGSVDPAPMGGQATEAAKQAKKARTQALQKTNGYLPKLSKVKVSVDALLLRINPETQMHSHRVLTGLSEDIAKVMGHLQERRQQLEAGTLEGADMVLKDYLGQAETLVTAGNRELKTASKLCAAGGT